MELLMLNKGIYLSTEDILVRVWGYESDAESGAVWVYISYVRKRLAAIGADIEIRYDSGNNSACRAYRRNKRFQLSHNKQR